MSYETIRYNHPEKSPFKVTEADIIIAELEKIKARIDKDVVYSNKWQVKNDSIKIIDDRISELKGERHK